MDLDLRGMTVDDGMLEVDRYIDLCARNGRKEFNIIHGKGTGALRAGIQAYLKPTPGSNPIGSEPTGRETPGSRWSH